MYQSSAVRSRSRARGVVAQDVGALVEAVLDGDGAAVQRARRGLGLVVRPVHAEQAEVAQRVADRAHLPVDHRHDPRRDRRARTSRCRAGSRRARCPGADCTGTCLVEPPVQLLDARQLAGLRRLPLLPPAPHLPAQEPLGMPEVVKPDVASGSIRGVRSRVATSADDIARRVSGRIREVARQRVAYDMAVDPFHHVEGSADHRFVVAQSDDVGHRDAGVAGARPVLDTRAPCRVPSAARGRAEDGVRRNDALRHRRCT